MILKIIGCEIRKNKLYTQNFREKILLHRILTIEYNIVSSILKKMYFCSMKYGFLFCLSILLMSLTSCIEIIDDLTIHIDGSGSLKYTVNLSASKVKINSALALDTLDGKPIPSIDEIKAKVEEFKATLAKQTGIKDVQIEQDYKHFIFKIQCDFLHVNQLETGIKQVVRSMEENHNEAYYDFNWINWENDTLNRSIPKFAINELKQLDANKLEELKMGKYTSITRFDNIIQNFENTHSKLSKNKMALMIQANTYDLTYNIDLLKNRIVVAK